MLAVGIFSCGSNLWQPSTQKVWYFPKKILGNFFISALYTTLLYKTVLRGRHCFDFSTYKDASMILIFMLSTLHHSLYFLAAPARTKTRHCR